MRSCCFDGVVIRFIIILETGRRRVGCGAFPREVAGEDMRTTPATSSKDGAFPVGGGVCGTVRATRAGEGGAEGGSPGTICGCATACGCVTTTADEFEAFACPAVLWMPQKSFTGSRNSTSIYPFTVGRFRALTTRQTTSRPCGFETVTA